MNPFPDIYPDAGYEADLESLGDFDLSETGILQVNVYDPAEVFHAVMHYKLIAWSDLETQFRPHYYADKDSNSGFSFFDFDPHRWTQLPCGTGDGATKIFTIPAKQVGGTITVYDNGSVTAAAYTILAGAGADGQDQISFATTAPASGHAVALTSTSARKLYTVLYVTRKWSPRLNPEGGDLYVLDLEVRQKVA